MFKKKNISVYSDLKTGFLCRLLLIIGVILLIIYIIQIFTSFFEISEDVTGMILAFSILFLGVGIILYFLSCQFTKLADIAKDIENNNISDEIEKSKK